MSKHNADIELQLGLTKESYNNILEDIKSIQKRLKANGVKLNVEIDTDKLKKSLGDLENGKVIDLKQIRKNLSKGLIEQFGIVDKDVQAKVKELANSLVDIRVDNLKIKSDGGIVDDKIFTTIQELSELVINNSNLIEKRTGVYDAFYESLKRISTIKISDTIRNDLGDDWNALRMSYPSKFSLTKGIEMDSIYQELSNSFQGIFSGTANPTEQFKELVGAIKLYRADVDKIIPLQADDFLAESVYEQVIAEVGKVKAAIKLGNMDDLASGSNEEANAMYRVEEAAKKASDAKEKFAHANKEVADTANRTVDAVNQEYQTMMNMDDLDSILAGVNAQGQSGCSVFQRFGTTLQEAFGYYTLANLLQDAIREVVNTAGDAVEKVSELNQLQTNLRMATGGRKDATSSLLSNYNEMGQELGFLTSSVSNAADAYLRQGHSIADTNELIADSLILSKVSELETAESTKFLTAIMQAYKLEAQDMLNVVSSLANVDLNAAVDAGGIAEAMSKTAVSAQLAGISMDELIAMVTTVGEVSQAGMSEVGNAIRTIFSRMKDVSDGNLSRIGDDGTIEDLSNIEGTLDAVGIKLRESNNEFRNMFTILDETADKWSEMSSVQKAAVAESYSGIRQSEKFNILMENWDKVKEYIEVSENSAGVASEKFDIYLESIESKTNSLKASLENLADVTISEGLYIDILDTAKAMVDLTADTGILKNSLTGLGTAGTLYAFKQLATYLKDATQGFANLNEAMNMTRAGSVSDGDFQKIIGLTQGLSKSQTKLVLSTSNLTDVQKVQVLVSQGMEKSLAEQQIKTWGLASAQQGTANATVTLTGALKGMYQTLLANPLVLVTLAVTAGATAWNKYKQSVENAREEALKTANTAKEEADKLEELYIQYSKLASIQDKTEAQEAEYKTVLEDVTEALAGKVSVLKDLKDGTDEYTEALKNASKEELKEAWGDAKAGTKVAKEKVQDALGFMGGNTEIAQAWRFGRDNEAYEIASKHLGEYSDALGTAWGLNSDDINKVLEYFYKVKSAKEEIEQLEDGSQIDTSTYENLSKVYSALSESIEEYSEQKYQELKLDYEVKNGIPATREEYEKMSNEILEASDISVMYKQVLKEMLDEDFSTLISGLEQVKEVQEDLSSTYSSTDVFALEDSEGNANELGNLNSQLDEIQNAYATIKDLTDSYSETGTISIDQLQSLISLGDDFLDYLVDEEGNLRTDAEAMRELAASRLFEMKVKIQQGLFDNLNAIQNEAQVSEYLTTTNYNLANSYKELARSQAEAWYTDAVTNRGISEDTAQKALNKYYADYDKVEKLFSNISASDISLGGGSSSGSSKSSSQPTEMDFFKIRLEEIDELITKVETHMENFTGASAKNISIDSLINLNTQKQSNLEKGIEMYQEYADTLLNKIPEQYRDATKNGSISLDVISDENTKEAIDNYRNAANSLADYTNQLEELKGVINQLYLDKFNNIEADFANQVGVIEDSVSRLQKIQDITSAKTKSESTDVYNQMIEETNKQIKYLQSERELLTSQMNEAMANGIDVASDEWFEMETTLGDVDDSILECTSSLLDFSDAIKQIHIDNFDNIVNVFEQMNDKISSNIDVLQNLSDFQEAKTDGTSRVYYDQMISNTELQIEKFEQQKSQLQSALNEAILKGGVEIGDADYTEMVSQIDSVTSAIIEGKSSIEEYKQAIKDIYVDNFNNISDNFSNQYDLVENANDILTSIADLSDSEGIASHTVYEQLMGDTTKQIEILNNKKEELIKSLNDAVSNGIEIGSEEWYEMYAGITECDNGILDAKNQLLEFQDTLNNLKWEQFDQITNSFEHIGGQIETVLQVIANEAKDLFSDEYFDINNYISGNKDFSELFTNEGKTTLGLYAQQYEMATMQNERYQKAINDLNVAYKNGEYTYEKYLEKLHELTDAQNEQSVTIYETKNAIKDLVDNALNAQLDAYSQLIDKQKEAIDKEKEMYEHKKTLAQKEKEIADIQAEIAARSGDDSSENQAEITQLQQELADKQSEMDDYLYDHSVNNQKTSLDNSVTNAESRLKEYLGNTEQLLADTLEFTKQSANDVYNTITTLCKDYGINIDGSIIDSWKDSETAIASYEQQVNTSTSAFMANLQTVENGIIREQEQTRIFTNDLITAFAVDPIQLNTNLDYIYQQLDTDRMGAFNFAVQLMNTYATPDDVLIQNLNDISLSLGNRIGEANVFGSSLSSAYNVDPTSLYNNLNNIANGLNTDKGCADTLKGALSQTFNADTYNIDGLIYSIGQLGDAISNAGRIAVDAGKSVTTLNEEASKTGTYLNNIKDGYSEISREAALINGTLGDTIGKSLHGYKVVDNTTGEVLQRFKTDELDNANDACNFYKKKKERLGHDISVQAFSKGGVVKDIKNPFDPIANILGEDHLVAVKNEEFIIPPEKMSEFLKNTNVPAINPDIRPIDFSKLKLISQPKQDINIETNVTIEGSVDKNFSVDNMVDKVSKQVKKDLYNSGKLLGMHKSY